jgi:hypothetical protein
MPDNEVWSWVELVLKVGNHQTIGGPDAFDNGHSPNLVSFFTSPSFCWYFCTRLSPNFISIFQGFDCSQSLLHLPKGQQAQLSKPLRWGLP